MGVCVKHGVPKVIYLQVCDEPDCDVPYDDHDGITWCSHRIDKTDVKYVLAKDKPQRTWVGLTDDDIADCAEKMEASDPTDSFWREFTQAIEAKLKDKNL